ncbi:TIGR04283 family arsenosugar biosynthesis glycosyltransferase [Tamlana sp. 2201CG12-4]|uniref:TIGR04283 family arsenosugar biosynthesis glycosyltransferase n=1 Tax=Tamlana sp. 2201CG12-4 TaxID=3112582 RepID=UPI002DB69373|nr:TIGR04283 family arsenosugar biosynthesis glycosyltransferase [Tamlana sp. 2201CG12-4]MEC3906817.1 TIGR04283 family arsenosugar biosynthesis glycosyltransferase [Tamlana sp. 2201CG12-4]
MDTKISIIIPVLNEEALIGKLLEHLISNTSHENISEIIVVDGGSSDRTTNIVNAFTNTNKIKNIEAFHFINNKSTDKNPLNLTSNCNIVLLETEKGRAKQMNSGAKAANGNLLYFLHADSFPPKDFDKLIIREIQKGNQAGCFRMQFNSSHWWLRLASWFTQFDWRACRGGDQSQFITKMLFNAIGGYDEDYIIYEDNILINQLYARNQYTVINKKLRTSARLYKKHGIWKLQYFYWRIYIKKWFGANAEDLYQYYKKYIS